MTTLTLIDHQTEICLADTTDYDGSYGTRTDQIDLTSLSASGGMRQSAKFDLAVTGVLMPEWVEVWAALEFATAPTAGGAVRFFMGFSTSATAGSLNPAGLSGSDAAYTGRYQRLQPVGSFNVENAGAGTVQIGYVGLYVPASRYGMLVVRNDADQALDTDATKMSIRMFPVAREFQA